MWALTLWSHGNAPLQWGVAVGSSLLATWADLRWRRIPNALSGSLLITGLFWAGWRGGWMGLADSLAAMTICAAPYLFLFLFAKGGAGDAKFMAGIGAWLGIINGLAALACVAVFGIVLAVGYSLLRKQHWSVLVNVGEILLAGKNRLERVVLRRDRPGTVFSLPSPETMQKMPYGPAILLGVVSAALAVHFWRG